MISLMQVRGFSPNTIRVYIDHLKSFADYFKKPPFMMGKEHIHAYQVLLVQEKKVSWSYFNQAVCALRFFLTRLQVKTGQSNISNIKNVTKSFR